MSQDEGEELPKSAWRRSFGLKLVAGSAVGMVICLGVCRLGFYQDRNIHDGGPGTADALGGVGFVVCGLLVVVGLVIAFIEWLADRGDD